MRVLIALGTSALSERGWPTVWEDPVAAAERAARSIAYVAEDHQVVVSHELGGGGPAAEPSFASLLCRTLEAATGGPVASVEATDHDTIRRLSARGCTVVCCARGAVPAIDARADRLAAAVDADMLVLATATPALWVAGRDCDEHAVRTASPASLRGLEFARPVSSSVAAARRFVERTGRPAAIGAIDHFEALVAEEAGTLIRADDQPLRFYGARSA